MSTKIFCAECLNQSDSADRHLFSYKKSPACRHEIHSLPVVSYVSIAVVMECYVACLSNVCSAKLSGYFSLEYLSRNRNLQTSKAPLESQAQGTSLFTSAEYLCARHLSWNQEWPLEDSEFFLFQLLWKRCL